MARREQNQFVPEPQAAGHKVALFSKKTESIWLNVIQHIQSSINIKVAPSFCLVSSSRIKDSPTRKLRLRARGFFRRKDKKRQRLRKQGKEERQCANIKKGVWLRQFALKEQNCLKQVLANRRLAKVYFK